MCVCACVRTPVRMWSLHYVACVRTDTGGGRWHEMRSRVRNVARDVEGSLGRMTEIGLVWTELGLDFSFRTFC